MSASAMLTIDASMKSRKATAVSRASVSLPRRVARKEGTTVVAVIPTTLGADSGLGRHPNVLVGWTLSRPGPGTKVPPDRRREIPSRTAAAAALADKPELPSAGHGLGSVVRAELVEDVTDVLLHGVRWPPANPRLPRPPRRRRQDPLRGHPLHQALHRPRELLTDPQRPNATTQPPPPPESASPSPLDEL